MATLLGMRTTAITVALATGISLFSPHIAQAATPPTSDDLHTTGAFLASQLEESAEGILAGPVGKPDIGLTTDVVFALDALGTHPAQADRSYAAITADTESFTHFMGEVDSSRLAKIVALEASRGERDSDRIAELVDAVQDDGRMMNETDGEPTSGMQNFGQSWSVIALARAGETTAAEKAASFLAGQICHDGGFPLFQADPPSCNSVDPDTTGLATQAMTLVYGVDHPAAQAGLGYLRANMDETGGIGSRFSGVNANTTALAAGAFAAAGDLGNLARTHEYLDSVRFGDTAPESLQGAFAWRTNGMDAVTSPNDQIVRASAQAALGFAGGSYINSEALYIDNPVEDEPSDTPAPTPPDNPGAGSSEGGILLGAAAAIIAVITAVLSFINPAVFLPLV